MRIPTVLSVAGNSHALEVGGAIVGAQREWDDGVWSRLSEAAALVLEPVGWQWPFTYYLPTTLPIT